MAADDGSGLGRRTGVIRSRLFSVVIGLLACLPPPAQAQTSDARALARRGIDHFQRAEYELAIGYFEASYRLHPMAQLLFDIAQAHRLAGDCEPARAHYARYLEQAADPRSRAVAQRQLTELGGCDGEAATAAAPREAGAADAALPGPADAPPAPATEPTLAPPPPPTLPTPAPVATRLTLAAPATSPSRWSTRRSLVVSGLAATGATLTLLGAGTYVSVEATARASEVSRLMRAGGAWDTHVQALDAAGRRDETAARVLFGVGAAVGIVASALLIAARRPSRLTVHAAISKDEGMLTCAGRF